MENIKLVESHIIKPNNELWKFVDSLCWKTRCLRNKANFILRKNFFSKKNHKYLNYKKINYEDYRELGISFSKMAKEKNISIHTCFEEKT